MTLFFSPRHHHLDSVYFQNHVVIDIIMGLNENYLNSEQLANCDRHPIQCMMWLPST